jgi:hypothetical protein
MIPYGDQQIYFAVNNKACAAVEVTAGRIKLMIMVTA